MWPDEFSPRQIGSFNEAVAPPSTEPGDGPLVCCRFNAAWLPYVLGALNQLVNPSSWVAADDAALDLTLDRATLLIDLVAQGGLCVDEQSGTVDVTIMTGNGSNSAVITFDPPFSAPPILLVSTDDYTLTASWTAVTALSATLILAASTPVTSDAIGTISWLARS